MKGSQKIAGMRFPSHFRLPVHTVGATRACYSASDTMAKRRMKVLSAVPGSTSFGPILRDFCRRGEGIVTAFSDSVLPVCSRFVDEDAAEVLPFGEVVTRYLTLCGEEPGALAKAGHVEVAIARACADLPDDSPFARTARYAGLHKAIARTLKELHEWGINREEMRRLAEISSPRLSAKLASLAQIDGAVEQVLLNLGC